MNTRKSFRHFAAATLCAALLGEAELSFSGSQDSGAGMQKLLAILHDRGSISDAEYAELKKMVQEEATTASAAPPAPAPCAAPAATAQATPPAAPASSSTTVASAAKDVAKSAAHWYEKLGIRGYTQVRYTSVFDQSGAKLDVPADKSATDSDTFLMRRGRVILSGDVHDHLFLYAQTDFSASLSTGDVALQMRDLYGDISLDADKEFRIRVGQSKVPYGFVNLQSSQNRLGMERPDALNSAFEGERDLGAFAYWAPKDIRARFRKLVSEGLRGSGDYGVLGFGLFTGQGPNKRDLNGVPHAVLRATYPFLLGDGQFVEIGVQGYTGRFVTSTQSVTTPAGTVTPAQGKHGVTDQRVGFTFVWYPQPFGVEAEWNIGRGPQLSGDATRIHSRSLQGGYLQLSWRFQNLSWEGRKLGEASPFVRWNYYEGGRKFAKNASADQVNELDIGIRWQPVTAVDLLLSYTPTFQRTNTSAYPYAQTDSAHRVGMQVQMNY